MNERTASRAVVLALSLLVPACSSTVQSGAAVGRVAGGLGSQSRTAPQGAEVCALTEALNALPGNEKPIAEGCAKAEKSDMLWRRVMGVLSAYGQMLQTLASGSGGENAGKVEAALTGVSGPDWIQVDGAPENAAKDAAAALVKQMSEGAAGGDLGKAITNAAPHVKAICEGLVPALEADAKGFADVQKEAEKKRASRGDRRCGTVSGTNVCVGESPIDRMVYGQVFAQGALLESVHQQTRDAVAGFCAAHKKLESAAAEGNLGKDQTYADVIAAIKDSRAAAPAADTKTDKGKPPAKK
jgi:hypothetical protein